MNIPLLSVFAMSVRSVRVAERLALSTSDHGVAGSNPAGGEILPEPKRRFIAQSLSCSPFHRLEMTEILLKGRKTLTHPSSIAISVTSILFIVLKTPICNPRSLKLILPHRCQAMLLISGAFGAGDMRPYGVEGVLLAPAHTQRNS